MWFTECHYADVVMLNVTNAECHYGAECHYAECGCAECHYAEFSCVVCHYAECGLLSVIMLMWLC